MFIRVGLKKGYFQSKTKGWEGGGFKTVGIITKSVKSYVDEWRETVEDISTFKDTNLKTCLDICSHIHFPCNEKMIETHHPSDCQEKWLNYSHYFWFIYPTRVD